MSSFVIKIIAIISMIFDHASDAIIGHFSFFNLIGRIAFPLFCFQLVNGFKHTKNIYKYMLRLIIFGIISQIPFSIFIYFYSGSFTTLNIFFTLALGLLAIYLLDKLPNNLKFIGILIDILIIALAEIIKVDYGWFGVALILCIYLFYKERNGYDKEIIKNTDNINILNKLKNNYLFTIIFFLLCFIKYCNLFSNVSSIIVWEQILFTFSPIIVMLLYNGKKGSSLKYFFYAFYPIHLAIFAFVSYLLHF